MVTNSVITNLSSHHIKSNNCYFFDNNIWMFLFCPIGNINKNKQQRITNFLSNLISRNCSIITNGLIISEFSNAYLRLDFDLFKREENVNAKFKKDYFPTKRAKDTRLAITSSIKQIDRLSEKFSDQYNSINLDNIFSYYVDIDFNDSYLIELCKQNNWIFVTDDNDFNHLSTGPTIIKL